MEFVYVVRRSVLFPEHAPQGFVPLASLEGALPAVRGPLGAASGRLEELLLQDGHFVEREYAERSPHLKQLIPYSIVTCDGRVLLVQRSAKGGEKRLHGKLSIGIGGHVNPEDLEHAPRPGRTALDAGSEREIAEELEVRGTYEVRRVGLLNDDSNAVGAVHLGIVQVVHVRGTVEIREKEQLQGRLVPCEELGALFEQGANFETWSHLLIPHVGKLLNLPVAVTS